MKLDLITPPFERKIAADFVVFKGKPVEPQEDPEGFLAGDPYVYGYLTKRRNTEENPAYLKYCIEREEKGVMMSYICIPETIRQWSGAVDRKHQMIFDGDIVLWYFNDHGGNDRVLAYEVTCRNEYQEYLPCGFLLKGTLKPLSREVMDDLEVVGNAYDNPDLIAEYKAKDDALADKRSY